MINPINACILAEPNWNTAENPWSRHVATPDGWCFVIPTRKTSPSFKYCVGYCYNSDITSKDDAEKIINRLLELGANPSDIKAVFQDDTRYDNRLPLT